MTAATKKPAARKAPAEKSDDAKDAVEQVVQAAEAASEDALDAETVENSERDAKAVDEPGMITVKVQTKYKDRLTGEIREPGAVLDVTQTRYDEIMAAGDFIVKQ